MPLLLSRYCQCALQLRLLWHSGQSAPWRQFGHGSQARRELSACGSMGNMALAADSTQGGRQASRPECAVLLPDGSAMTSVMEQQSAAIPVAEERVLQLTGLLRRRPRRSGDLCIARALNHGRTNRLRGRSGRGSGDRCEPNCGRSGCHGQRSNNPNLLHCAISLNI